MAKKLTDIAIRNIKPDRDKRREIPAGDGLYLIVQPSGAKSWALRYRLHGKPQKLTLGGWFAGDIKDAPEPKLNGPLTLKGARELATAERRKIDEQGHDPRAAKAKAMAEQERQRADTFRAVAERYMKREAGMRLDAKGNSTSFDDSKLRTGRERWLMLERSAFPTLGGRPVAEIRKSDIIKLLDRLADGELRDPKGKKIAGGPVAADRLLAVIRKIFSWHASREDNFRSPIVAGMNRVKTADQSRDRTLSDFELRTIWRTASQLEGPFPAYVRFLLLTGCRRAEASKMTWAEVSSDGDWMLPASRNKVKRDLVRPLSKAAQDLLAAQPRFVGCAFVFTNNGKRPIAAYSTYKKRFDAAVLTTLRDENPEAAPLANWTLHDLRRTARTLMGRAGVPSDHAERCLGHTLKGVEGIYNRHQYREEMARAYEALAAMLERIVNPPAANVVAFQPVAGNVYGQA
jgi:integrase